MAPSDPFCIADTEQSALLVASENLPSRSLKIAVGQSRQIDSETPADLTPREGLGGAAVKLLDAQLSNPRDSSEVAVWYKDKEVCIPHFSNVHSHQIEALTSQNGTVSFRHFLVDKTNPS